ncbi:MAG: GNAT family N-acetyltransferase [Rhodoferax sp.]
MPVHIHTAPADFQTWSTLLALLQDAFAYMDARIDPPSSLRGMTADDLRRKAQAETLILAQEGSQLQGCAFAALRQDCVYVGKVAVAGHARGRGIARALFDAAEQLARQHQRAFLELQTRVELLENHRTFAALGFEKVAETAHPGYDRPTSITMRRAVRL